jgi:exopolysaccharide biosynthesis polyprenyl glycosylphosphotransferase
MRRKQGTLGIVVLDVILINLAFVFSYIVRYEWEFPYPVDPRYDAPFWPYIPFAILLTTLCLIGYQMDGLYERRSRRRWMAKIYGLTTSTATSIVFIMALTFFLQPLVYSRGMLVLVAVLIVVFLSLARLGQDMIQLRRRQRGIGVERVLIVGAGEIGRAVMRTILGDASLGYQMVGYVDDDPSKGTGHLGRIKGLGKLNQIPSVIVEEKVDEVIVTLSWQYHRKIMDIVSQCERENVRVRVVPDVFQQRMQHVDLDSLSGIPLIGPGPAQMGSSAMLVKRIIDLTLTILAMPVLVIIFIVVAVLIKLDSSGPVIFRQRRVGKNGQEFDVYKFRSMIDGAEKMQAELADLNEAEGPLFKIKDDPRVTRVGRIIRQTSVDELPQLINVLKGDMSIIGPRPGTPDEVAQYEPWQRERLRVRPGITGLWQVSGRSDVPFDEMCLLDIFYIDNWSLDLDIRIFLQTIPYVLTGKGAY